MSDNDEAADGQALAFEEARKLHKVKPDHPLLKYCLHPDDDVVWEEFVAKFGKPGISRERQRTAPAVAYMYAMYWVTLRKANANPDQEIAIDHGPTRPATSTAATYSPARGRSIADDIY